MSLLICNCVALFFKLNALDVVFPAPLIKRKFSLIPLVKLRSEFLDIFNTVGTVWTSRRFNGVFPKWSRTFIEFNKFRGPKNQWSMAGPQFKDPVSHMCLTSAVVAPWFLGEEVEGSSPFNDNYFCHWICRVQWKH